MTKIKEVIADQKKHVRFGEWEGKDVSKQFFCVIKFKFKINEISQR